MSYIHDDVQMIKAVIKYIDEDKIVDFLNSIEFEFNDLDVGSYILQTDDLKLIELCVNWHLECDYVDELLEVADELVENGKITGTAINIVKDKLVKQDDPDVIYAILNSSLVIWERGDNPFETGFYDRYNVSNASILNQEEVNTLFSIYADHEGWYEHKRFKEYVRDKEALTEKIKKEGGAPSIDEVIDFLGEDFVQDYFDGNIPKSINSATYADMLIEGDVY